MATVYAAALRTTRMQAVITAVGATGYLVIGTSELNGATSASTGVLAKLPLDNPAGIVSGDILTFAQPITVVASGTGTAAKAEVWDTETPTGAADVIISGLTVGTESTNVVLGTTSINTGNTVSISPATITHATT